MEVDHTKEVETKSGAIHIAVLDNCSFYQPRPGSLVAVKMCAYCKYSVFLVNQRQGVCKYHQESKKG